MSIEKKVLILGVLAAMCTATAWADNDGDEEGERGFGSRALSFFSHKNGVENVGNKLYKESCGECHFAYQPGLLPSASWERLLSADQLSDHFGENAELNEADRKKVLEFVTSHAAEKSNYRVSMKIANSVDSSNPPLRITKTRYIERKHHELSDRLVKNNKDVRFLGNCTACHRKATEGTYDEDTVSIPNFPRWDD
ncbi:MAG: cytochrome C [Gammaproteobacteria bacterium]|nr:cytochrome C [Gammaproteobacteria bacterium]